jgi:hypothetical protein
MRESKRTTPVIPLALLLAYVLLPLMMVQREQARLQA